MLDLDSAECQQDGLLTKLLEAVFTYYKKQEICDRVRLNDYFQMIVFLHCHNYNEKTTRYENDHNKLHLKADNMECHQ